MPYSSVQNNAEIYLMIGRAVPVDYVMIELGNSENYCLKLIFSNYVSEGD